MYRIYLVTDKANRSKSIVVSLKLDKEFRLEYPVYELLTMVRNKKEAKASAIRLQKNYKADEVIFPFFIPFVQYVPFHLRSKEGQQKIIDANKRTKTGVPRSEETKRKISQTMRGHKKSFAPEYIEQLKVRRTKAGCKFKWIHEPYSGETKQLKEGCALPDGWRYGRPGIKEWIVY